MFSTHKLRLNYIKWFAHMYSCKHKLVTNSLSCRNCRPIQRITPKITQNMNINPKFDFQKRFCVCNWDTRHPMSVHCWLIDKININLSKSGWYHQDKGLSIKAIFDWLFRIRLYRWYIQWSSNLRLQKNARQDYNISLHNLSLHEIMSLLTQTKAVLSLYYPRAPLIFAKFQTHFYTEETTQFSKQMENENPSDILLVFDLSHISTHVWILTQHNSPLMLQLLHYSQ